MNRESRRDLEQKLRSIAKNSDSKAARKKIRDFLTLYNTAAKLDEPDNNVIHDGDKVMINVKSCLMYDNKTEKYKEFVRDNEGVVFTAVYKTPGIYTFAEDDTWLFLRSELVVVKDEESTDD